MEDITGTVSSSTYLRTDSLTTDNLKERDFGRWLENKLSGDDRWNSRAAGSLLTPENLANVGSCFIDLTPHVQVKVLLGLLHLPKRTMDICKEYVDPILDLASKEADEWVQTIALLVMDYPKAQAFSTDNISDDQLFIKTLTELRTQVREKAKSSNVSLIPLDSAFVSKTIATSQWINSINQNEKDFALKRRPKSATLRAELLQKSKDTLLQPKGKTAGSLYSSVLPLRAKSMAKKTNSSPLRGLPTQSAVKSSQGFSATTKTFNHRPSTNVKKEGGVKFIEIEETPQALKRKRKLYEEQEREQKKFEKEELRVRAVEEKEARRRALEEEREQRQRALAAIHEQNRKEAASVKTVKYDAIPKIPCPVDNAGVDAASTSTVTPAYAIGLQSVTNKSNASNLPPPIPPVPSAVSVGISVIRPNVPRPNVALSHYPPRPPAPYQNAPTFRAEIPGQMFSPPQNDTIMGLNQQLDSQSQKVYSISKEVMLQAQDMFRTANKLSRPEKALILGFMAGNRENPCPQMGQILTVRLSELREVASLPNDPIPKPVLSETFFQMNYDTGEWKRLKKMRTLTTEELVQNPVAD